LTKAAWNRERSAQAVSGRGQPPSARAQVAQGAEGVGYGRPPLPDWGNITGHGNRLRARVATAAVGFGTGSSLPQPEWGQDACYAACLVPDRPPPRLAAGGLFNTGLPSRKRRGADGHGVVFWQNDVDSDTRLT